MVTAMVLVQLEVIERDCSVDDQYDYVWYRQWMWAHGGWVLRNMFAK
jgi:hypothetical protein